MNWSDEHYVKLYTRETATSRSWPWQTTALWPNLLKHVDGAGILEFGRLKPAHAVSVVTGLPISVVEPGLKALVEDGTVEVLDRVLIIPNFVEAQEARKSEALKKADQRQRHKAKLRLQTTETTSPHVPRSPAMSPDVPLQPSPAQPSPALLKDLSPKKPATPPNPRLQFLKVALVADYLEVRGEAYAHQGSSDTQGLKRLLPLATDEKIRDRWRAALRRTTYPLVSTLAQLAQKWPDLAAPAPPPGKGPVLDVSQTTHTGAGNEF